MLVRKIGVAALLVFSAVSLRAQDPESFAPRELVRNWTAPPVWSPERAAARASGSVGADTFASSPMPFIAITPCRIVDTRGGGVFTGAYGPPALLPNTSRDFDLNSSPHCTGIPEEVTAYSLNFTVTNTGALGDLRAWPRFNPPVFTTSVLNWTAPGTIIANATVIPAGGDGWITVMAAGTGANVLIDINGYYAAASQGTDNTFLGLAAGNDTMTGDYNTGIGSTTLNANTSGGRNIAVGSFSLFSNESGNDNIGVGYAALTSNILGHDNTALGSSALFTNSDGHYNTVVGLSTLTGNLSGSSNTAIGFNALHFGSGSNNTAIGSQAGSLQTSGSNNIYIGNRGNPSLPGESGQIRIGDVSLHSGTVIVGIYGAGSSGGIPVIVNVGGRLGTMQSSRRVKEDIRDIGLESDRLMRLRPVSFRYRPDLDSAGLAQYGLIAEEVAEVYPELVVSGRDGRPEAVRYQLLDPLLLSEVQKQRRSLEAQQTEIEKLKGALARIEARLAAETTP